MQISEPSSPDTAAWLRLGFRPFFLAAGGYAVLGMLVWYASFMLHWKIPFNGLSPAIWHGHEMIYGYSMAVVAGFLLTAVRNWTGIQTIRGAPLLFVFLCWLLARLFLLFTGADYQIAAASFDLLFMALFAAAIAMPIVKVKQWTNLVVVINVILLFASNLVFYLGVTGVLEQGVYWGLYSGLYLILVVIFTLSRRVVPFFIERGVGYPVELRNSKWVDISSMVLFVGFWIADIVQPNGLIVAVLASLLFVLHLWRLLGWHTPGIWKKPLLWSLYLAYAAIIAGFALKAAAWFAAISPTLGLHAFTVGGIGMMTLGMMSRVALGHTGRNVFEPPRVLFWVFLVLFATLLVRVVLPMTVQSYYPQWIALSQWLWAGAFLWFLTLYCPILTRPRVDGQDG